MTEDVKVDIQDISPIPNAPKCFSWKNVNLSVTVNKTKKQLLTNVSGEVRAGEMIAIMGGSGAGKSTLLNTLAGRIGPGELSGDILLDGKKRSPRNWTLQCAYVEQDDILFKQLTVFETLRYSALLRLPRTMTIAEKEARVNSVISQLGLTGCKNTPIGDELVRGISGGERKRVSIGIELVTNPHILFLDEPTSGLDAFNAFNTIQSIKELAKKENKLVLMTIHQPRTDILELFDKVLLLSVGKVMWFGSTTDAITHFDGLGYKLPPKTNPSDYFIDIITIDQRDEKLREESLKRIALFQEAYEKLVVSNPNPSTPPEAVETSTKVAWPSLWINEFFIILHRYIINMTRDKAVVFATLGQACVNLLIVSILYYNVTNDIAGIQNRIGVFFFLTLNMTFGNVMPTVNAFPETKKLIKRERAAGSYRATSAYLAKVASTVPLVFIVVIILGTPLYWIVGLYNNVANFFTFLLILLIQALVANLLGLMIGSAVPSATVGQIVTPLVLIVFVLFSGLLLNLDTAPVFLRWIQWISFLTYTMKAFVQNEFNANAVFSCTHQPCFPDGPSVVKSYGFGTPDLWGSIAVNAGLGVAFLILGTIVFSYSSKPLMRLK
ncbi:hypothetical protein HK103_001362 [Boothiomyces macroporosus]|uniref:ABC transporter domain-containing protein n=1 Tax=Boothiomyces macroporosus TaxID=261099 RepID=A0AAD5UEB1_9FUNG|nr:hypothetical protein HK103_001362 [Boothiomyces macroporosus]